MIDRLLEDNIKQKLNSKKAIIIYGPRQSGKTTLLKSITEKIKMSSVLWLNGDDGELRQKLELPSVSKLKNIIGKNQYIIIDEAQRIKNIGLCIKIIVDNIPKVQVIASGSSSFELANKINEPLTGRKWEYFLFPLSFEELVKHYNFFEAESMLEQRLIYGSYPEIVKSTGSEIPILKQLADSYLYKDILMWENIKKPDRLERLIQALSFQVGSEVSYNELGQTSGLDNETVEKYIHLLEKAFIIFRLGCFSRNLRSELKKSRKIYFYDTGLRNAVINNFNPLSLRNDKGALWENYLICERMKYLHYHQIWVNRYFWRTLHQQEIDYIEERNGKLYAFELKWKKSKEIKFPQIFLDTYPENIPQLITKDNFTEFITKDVNFVPPLK